MTIKGHKLAARRWYYKHKRELNAPLALELVALVLNHPALDAGDVDAIAEDVGARYIIKPRRENYAERSQKTIC